jgi:hypothetical protein
MDKLTEKQWERLAYGTVLSIVNQALDNGELPDVDLHDYVPSDWYGMLPEGIDEEEFYTDLKARVEKVLSGIEEEAAKRDG